LGGKVDGTRGPEGEHRWLGERGFIGPEGRKVGRVSSYRRAVDYIGFTTAGALEDRDEGTRVDRRGMLGRRRRRKRRRKRSVRARGGVYTLGNLQVDGFGL